ncbi:MAG: DNA alkylation repair protein, partial [Methanocorpusculum sp.]|nr:DNA alkylation repair protein [Methanocorpusculum sp.]
VCDSVAMGLKIAEKYPDTFWKFALQHIDSDREFFIRFGVVMLLSHYVDEKHIDSVLNILDKIPSEEHYVKMAVAWAVSVCYVKFPEKSHAYLLNCHLNDDTYNKSIQKIIESYRVDDEAKNNLRNMRRK